MIEDIKTRLIATTKPSFEMTDESGAKSAQDIVAYCARVSNPKNQERFDTSEKLLEYLITHAHWSPFEMVNLVIEVKAPRTITRQILRHRSCAFQEFSGRYAEFKASDFTYSECRTQDTTNRQNSIKSTDNELNDWWFKQQTKVLDTVLPIYEEALKRGVAKEQARDILPEGMTPSVLYIQGSLRSWYHYCLIRTEAGVTQAEHVEVAQQIWRILVKEFPLLEKVNDKFLAEAAEIKTAVVPVKPTIKDLVIKFIKGK